MTAKGHIVVAVPAYTGTVHLATVRSLFADMLRAMADGYVVSVQDEAGSADIGATRAEMVAKFLYEKGTHLVFIDADVCWQAGAMNSLVSHDVDIVAGSYPHRKDPISFPMKWDDGQESVWSDEKGLIEVKGCAAGFLCVKRHVLEAMVKAYPDLEFATDRAPGGKAWGLFDTVREPNRRLGEDYSFCHRARECGFKIKVDPSISMGHIGSKVFVGTLGEHMRENHVLPVS